MIRAVPRQRHQISRYHSLLCLHDIFWKEDTSEAVSKSRSKVSASSTRLGLKNDRSRKAVEGDSEHLEVLDCRKYVTLARDSVLERYGCGIETLEQAI